MGGTRLSSLMVVTSFSTTSRSSVVSPSSFANMAGSWTHGVKGRSVGRCISAASPRTWVSLTPVSSDDATAAPAAVTPHTHRTAMPCLRTKPFTMRRRGNMDFISPLSVTGNRSAASPEDFGLNGQLVAGARLLPPCGDFLFQGLKTFQGQAFGLDIAKIGKPEHGRLLPQLFKQLFDFGCPLDPQLGGIGLERPVGDIQAYYAV